VSSNGLLASVALYGLMGATAAAVLYWLANLALVLRVLRVVPLLVDVHPPSPAVWPALSLIIPACDEADTLAAAVQSRLQEGYPRLEVVLVDDRSRDGTGALVDQLAAADPRVRAVHLRELPDGWLGKVHALQRGTEEATGEWLLYSDADVHLAPGTLTRAVAYAEQRGLEHVALMPELWSNTFLLDCALGTFVRVLCLAGRPWAAANPRSPVAVGIGAFNLVRRPALQRSPGFVWLKLEVVDDVGLARMLKASGARTALLNGCGFVALDWYRSLAEAASGAEKSVFATVGGFSVARLAGLAAGILLLELLPFLLLPAAVGRWCASGTAASPLLTGLGALAALSCGAALLAQGIICRWARRPLLPSLLVPVGVVLNVWMSLRAGWLAVRRGGLLWRGVLYPLERLRQGARLRFP
jgi:hypothetical protein